MTIVTPDAETEAVCGTEDLSLSVGREIRIGTGTLSFAIIFKIIGIASAGNGLRERSLTDCIAQCAIEAHI